MRGNCPAFISDTLFGPLSYFHPAPLRLSGATKERDDFTINDAIIAEGANAFAVSVGNDAVLEGVERTRDKVSLDLLITFVRIGDILQPIDGEGEFADAAISDSQLDLVQ